MILNIEIQNIPNQTFSVLLDEQECDIQLRQMGSHLFASLTVENRLVFQNVLCGNASPLNGFEVLEFKGVLFFVDTQGNEAPQWEGLGERWKLYFATPDEDIYRELINEQSIHN